MTDRIVVYVTKDGHSRALDLFKRLGAAAYEIGHKVNGQRERAHRLDCFPGSWQRALSSQTLLPALSCLL